MRPSDLEGFGPVGSNAMDANPSTEKLAADAFEAGERVRALEMMNTPTDYQDRKRAFVELQLAREAATRARQILETRVTT